MGIIYCGPFADAINEGTRWGYEHEGYAVQILRDGAESDRWVPDCREHRPACGCGWRGVGVYPPTDAGETAATDEWEVAHLRPLIGRAAAGKVLAATSVLHLLQELRRELTAAVDARGVDEPLTERERGRCDVIEVVERHLYEHAVNPPTPSGRPVGTVRGAW